MMLFGPGYPVVDPIFRALNDAIWRITGWELSIVLAYVVMLVVPLIPVTSIALLAPHYKTRYVFIGAYQRFLGVGLMIYVFVGQILWKCDLGSAAAWFAMGLMWACSFEDFYAWKPRPGKLYRNPPSQQYMIQVPDGRWRMMTSDERQEWDRSQTELSKKVVEMAQRKTRAQQALEDLIEDRLDEMRGDPGNL